MPDNKPHNQNQFRLRARLPQYFRIAAVGAIGITILVVVAGFYRARSKSPFKLKSEHTQLSTNVVADINGYERLETDAGVSKYYIKADHARTFSDNHQELENVYFEMYDKDGTSSDKMKADNALYIPDEDKNFTAYLKGNVHIETKDALKIKTNNITYSKKNDTAEVDELVEFERENIRGRSFGATVRLGLKQLELLKDVEIETFESPELAKSNIRYAKVNSRAASFDQINNKIELNDNVVINIASKAKSGNPQSTDVNADRALLNFAGDSKSPELKKLELFNNVRIVSTEQGAAPTTIESGYALYDKDADRYDLKDGAHITTTANAKATDVRSSEAIYEQTSGKLELKGNAEITQGGEYLKGDVVNANLFPDKKVKDAVVRGSAFLKQTTPERTLTVAAPELNAAFDQARQLSDANAIGASIVEITPADAKAYSLVTVNAARGIGVLFKGDGLVNSMRTDGRTTVQLSAADGKLDAANKRVTADAVTAFFQANGKDIKKTEAVGNAELYVEPLTADKKNYRTTITAPRFDCEFFPTGNNAKTCVAGKKAKAVRVPTVASEGHGNQNLSAEQLTAEFDQATKDIVVMDADGGAKFTELDRNAIANRMTFTQADETMRLRGGEPTIWDSRGRGHSREIDVDTKNNRSYLRGGVSTTYYSQKQIKDSSPFGSSDKPVFMTSDNAEFDNVAQTATYTGNARGWQENNYVRGDKIFLDENGGRFESEGNVQSVLYNVKAKKGSKDSNVPTSASAGSMTYEREKRILQYRTNVDIRQGTDRMTSASADIYLNEKNEVSKTIAETNVVLTQPGRRAAGNWVQYTADDEVAVIRGNPAVVTDPVNGTSQSEQMTFSMRDNRVTSEGRSKQNTTGRTRSVYKVKPNQ